MKRGTFRDLNIWKKGLNLLLNVHKLSKSFPQDERFGLTTKLIGHRTLLLP